MMAAGRMRDGNHTALQTVAGVALGPALGWMAHVLARHYGLGKEPLLSSPAWQVTSVVCVMASFVYLGLHSGPVWLASVKRWWQPGARALPGAPALAPVAPGEGTKARG